MNIELSWHPPHTMCALCDPELSEETLQSYITKAEEKLGFVLKDKQCEQVECEGMMFCFD